MVFKPLNDMAFLKEFKEFALKGNVMDMAVGVIIGGAFGKIVNNGRVEVYGELAEQTSIEGNGE